jgi:DNA-damage-inducible protein D
MAHMKKPEAKRNDGGKEMAFFEEKEVRRTWHDEQWYFAVNDIVEILTNSNDVRQYIKKIRSRDKELSVNWGTICTPLDIIAKDGKRRQENMAKVKGIFRIIQSIPSPKAEPFKQWLAQVGQERIEEIQDPERAIVRAKRIYEQKGYSDDWIAKRMRGINVRNTLTDEWKNRGARGGIDFAILTNEIYKGTFDMNAKGIKKYKDLDNPDNPRDHMSELELILTMLGEATTTELSQVRDSKGMPLLSKDAKEGGEVAGNTRKEIEEKTGKKVLGKGNFLKDSNVRLKKKNKD